MTDYQRDLDITDYYAIEARARAMRAEAMRETVVWLGDALRRQFSARRSFATRSADQQA